MWVKDKRIERYKIECEEYGHNAGNIVTKTNS